jgi:para-aminobenzoate synthetase/4-amino-4-deoxychorismate lyase
MRRPTEWARFDDLRTERAQLFPEIAFDLVAWNHEDVAAVLAEVERVTADGWWAYGFVSYEAAPGLDPNLLVHPPTDGLPLIWFGVTSIPLDVPAVTSFADRDYTIGPWSCDWTRATHRDRVATVRARIAEGETYQCNLTTRMRTQMHGDTTQFYSAMTLGQRGAYNAYLDLGRYAIASASPELFFELRADRLTMRPMKGTAPRGRTDAEDSALLARLQASEKERAENVMIVDLIRNDLARLAATGTVSVSSLCASERFETVHQLTSTVSARLRADLGLVDIFRALFPCGSVTGAPKCSTMRMIRELEDTPRGIYCGAIGVVAPPDNEFRARFSVAIRTTLIDRDHGTALYGSGGGITWSSDPDAEYEELLTKAKVLYTRPADIQVFAGSDNTLPSANQQELSIRQL